MSDDKTFPSLMADAELTPEDREFVMDLVVNEFYYRQEIAERLGHPKRDLYKDCGYPDTNELTPEAFKELYDRFPIARRVIDLPVEESWRAQPEVFENEDGDDTEFETSWKELNKQLRGEESWFQDEEGSPIWERCERIDKLSRIGHYGVMFLEFGDVGTPKQDGSGDSTTWADPAPGFEDDRKATATTNKQALEDKTVKDEEFRRKQEKTKPKKPKVELLGIRCFDETLAKITDYVTDENDRRHGLPLKYTLTLTREEQSLSGTVVHGSTTRDVEVHWSRVVHIADLLGSSEVVSVPACQPIANHLMDLEKVYGASGEGYWRAAFPGLSFESHPQLGGKAKLDTTGIKRQIIKYQNTLQRYLATSGGTVKSISGEIVDPSPHVESKIEAICIYLGCPIRVFKGSERGELASTQDKDTWDERMSQRRINYITPRLIVPLVDRLIKVGVLPEPKGYSVDWPDLDAMTKDTKARIALVTTQTLSLYVNGGADVMIDPLDFMTRIMDIPIDEAEEILKSAQEYTEEKEAEELEQAEMMRQKGLGPDGQPLPVAGEQEGGPGNGKPEGEMSKKEKNQAKAKNKIKRIRDPYTGRLWSAPKTKEQMKDS